MDGLAAVNPTTVGTKKAVNPTTVGTKKAVNPTTVGTKKGMGRDDDSLSHPYFYDYCQENYMHDNKKQNIKIYRISQQYYRYLKRFDSKIPSLTNGKEKRPFVGIVLDVNGCSYFAPLTSPKLKHRRMRNTEDFIKIDGGTLGAINLNNMIPVPTSEVSMIELVIKNSDSAELRQYKTLLEKQREWCNQHKSEICNKAKTLRRVVSNPEREGLRERCCNFEELESRCTSYGMNRSIPYKKQDEYEI